MTFNITEEAGDICSQYINKKRKKIWRFGNSIREVKDRVFSWANFLFINLKI